MFGDLFRELGGRSACKGQQFNAWGRVAFEEMIDERHERRTFPSPRSGQDARVTVMVMPKNCALLSGGHVRHTASNCIRGGFGPVVGHSETELAGEFLDGAGSGNVPQGLKPRVFIGSGRHG